MSTHDLDGTWTLRRHGRAVGAVPQARRLARGIPARMPGSVHLALQAAGIIPDPYLGRDELAVQWVDRQDWSLERTLTASAQDCAAARQELSFGGIDTIATVQLNGRTLATSVNMFRPLVIDCRGRLRRGANRLTVLLSSPTRWAAAAAARSGGQVRPDEFVWQTGERRPTWRTAIRKVQCHFGWDWGTYLATSGLWRHTALACSDAPRIASLALAQQHHGPAGAPRRVTLRLEVAVAGARPGPGQVVGVLMGGRMPRQDRRERKVISASAPLRLRAGATTTATLTLEVEDPVLWWPAHEGGQYLYYLSLHASDAAGNRSPDTLFKIGLRTLEVVTEDGRAEDGSPAQGLCFQVNGRRIFAKGANWIPADQFIERCTRGVLRHLLSSMVEANMNMVRVWGGGWYEQEAFYDLCDELGLLVWQDFMMAGFSPDRPAFLRELAAEARDQVRRLAWRPALALWCGDNECNHGVVHWWKEAGTLAERLARYRAVIGTVAAAVRELDPGRRFWPSSPSNGVIDAEPDAPARGDIHYWQVWHGRQPFSAYLTVRPRFVSEFGFQSFPEPRTLIGRVPAAELNPSSRVMEHHQRSPDGNLLITNTMAREMRIPKDLDSFCWVSQINQALAMRTAVEHWRRLKPWCMGTLYWQLNDLWPVASWSSIDWDGRWKVLHHAAGRFYAPLLPSLLLADGTLQAWATSDLPEALDLEVRLEVRRWDGRPVASRRLRRRLAGQASSQLAAFPLGRLLPRRVEPHQVCCFLELRGRSAGRPERVVENFAPLVPWKWAELCAPRLTTRLLAGPRAAGAGSGAVSGAVSGDGSGAVSGDGSGLQLEVASQTVTPFFHAELRGAEGHFQGDWQVLRPGTTYRLPWLAHGDRGATAPSLAEARAQLRTLSLWDTFSHEPSSYQEPEPLPAGRARHDPQQGEPKA